MFIPTIPEDNISIWYKYHSEFMLSVWQKPNIGSGMKLNPNISIISVWLTVFSWLAWEKVVSLRALLSGQPGHILNQENKRNLKKLSEKLLSVMVKGAILTSRSEEAAPAFLCLVVAMEQLYHRCMVFCARLEESGISWRLEWKIQRDRWTANVSELHRNGF